MLKIVKNLAFDSHVGCLLKFSGCQKPLGMLQLRAYKAEFNIEWLPPPKVPFIHPSKSGDKSGLPEVDLKRPQYYFSRSCCNTDIDELTEKSGLPEELKKLITLEFASHRKHVQVIKHDAMEKIRRHVLDTASMETRITAITVSIRNQQRHIEEKRTDKTARVLLKENIDKRKALLKRLRAADYKRFEWLLEKLDLVYHATPNPIIPITKKDSLIKLTQIYCDNIRKQQLDDYKKELEKEKVLFDEEKKQTLKWIEEEEKVLGLKQ